MDLDSFLVSLYVLTENWWKATHAPADARVGRPSLISDPEILTLAILAQWPRFRSERDFHRFAEAHLREYSPRSPPKASSTAGRGLWRPRRRRSRSILPEPSPRRAPSTTSSIRSSSPRW